MLLTLTLPHRLLNLSSSSSPRLALLLFLFFSSLMGRAWALFWGKRMHVTRSSHLEMHDWLQTCHMETDAFRVHKKTPTDICDRLITTDYNHTITEWSNYRIFVLFWDYWSYIVQRAKLSYKYDNYRTPGNTVSVCWNSGQFSMNSALTSFFLFFSVMVSV